MLKSVMTRSALMVLACSLSVQAIADGARRAIHIPPGELAAALDLLAKQSGTDLVYRPEQVQGLKTQGIDGEFSTEEAVTRLLDGTSLILSIDSTGAVLIAAPLPTGNSGPARPAARDSATPPSAATQGQEGLRNRLRLAQADNSPVSRREDLRGAEVERSLRESIVELEQITVTGTHIRGTDNPTAPLIVMDREYIQATGLTTAVQLLESLPQNFALVNQSSAGGVLSGNSSSMTQGASINLRGMGEGTTLTLVNGRRMPLGYDGSTVNIVALPLSAIERVTKGDDAFALLEYLGAESAGPLVLLPPDKDVHERGGLQGLSDDELSRRIRNLPRTTLSNGAPKRMSVAGAQNKLLVVYRDCVFYEPVGSEPSTHILKPNHVSDDYPASVINEYFVMSLARKLKLRTPPVFRRYVPEPVHVVERFDRHIDATGNTQRRHIIDACQLLNKSRGFKYQTSRIRAACW